MVAIPAAAEEILSEEEIQVWVDLVEQVEEDPAFLPFLQQEHPEQFEAFVAGVQRMHSLGSTKLWRAADGTAGSARPDQLMPGTPGSAKDRTDWRVWLLMAGRGSGKSWAAAHCVRELLVNREWNFRPHFALVSNTLESVRVDMIEGALEKVLGHEIRRYNRSTLEIWLHNGAYIKGYSSERASRLRGPNFVGAWADEIASWLDADCAPSEDSTWSNLEFATRSSDGGDWDPKIIATTTPKPVRLLRVRDKRDDFYPGLVDDPGVVLTHMTTADNVHNLAPSFHKRLLARYEGSRLGRQEIGGELLDEIEGALWTQDTVESMNSSYKALMGFVGGLHQIVVAVDPTVGDGAVSNDECGIVVAGLGYDGNVWILEDATVKGQPSVWCSAVGNAYMRWGASQVVAEKTQGGTLVREVLDKYAADVPIKLVPAKDSKRARAEGPAVLSEQGKVKFAHQRRSDNVFALLQDQLTTWDPLSDESPDRLDAFVYAVTYFKPSKPPVASVNGRAYAGSRGRRRGERRSQQRRRRRRTLNGLDASRNPQARRRIR